MGFKEEFYLRMNTKDSETALLELIQRDTTVKEDLLYLIKTLKNYLFDKDEVVKYAENRLVELIDHYDEKDDFIIEIKKYSESLYSEVESHLLSSNIETGKDVSFGL